MSEERTAERPRHLCAAYSCPLLGVMSDSTRGGDDWLCFCHFGKDPGTRDEITSHLHGMDWLCRAVTELRTLRGEDSRKAYERIRHDLDGNRPLLAEFEERGFIAFEEAIGAQLRAAMEQRQQQQPFPA